MNVDGEEFDITKDFIDVRIDAKEGFAVEMENNLFKILDTTPVSYTHLMDNSGFRREFNQFVFVGLVLIIGSIDVYKRQ